MGTKFSENAKIIVSLNLSILCMTPYLDYLMMLSHFDYIVLRSHPSFHCELCLSLEVFSLDDGLPCDKLKCLQRNCHSLAVNLQQSVIQI